MALGAGLIQRFDDMVNNLILGPLDRGLSALSSSIGNALSGGGSSGASLGGSGEGLLSSISGFFRSNDGPSIEPSRAPSMEIQAPAQQISSHHVDMADIGGFPAPTFSAGAAVRSSGQGMTMNG